jgi:superfamily I DNA/RNA helicase
MKIHQAKNREFDNVIVLWPYQVTGTSAESLRRLLYNGITRAKLRALVIVQSLPKQTRLSSPPFAP